MSSMTTTLRIHSRQGMLKQTLCLGYVNLFAAESSITWRP